MYTVALDCVLSQHLVFLVNALLLTQRCVGFYFRHFRSNVGEDKEFVVVHFFSQPSTTFIRQVDRIHLFINNKVKRLDSFGHSFVVILHIDFFRLEHTSFYARFGEELNERFVFRQSLVAAIEREETFFCLSFSNQFLRFGKILSSEFSLNIHEAFYQRLILLIHLIVTLRHRTRNNQRRTSVINKH